MKAKLSIPAEKRNGQFPCWQYHSVYLQFASRSRLLPSARVGGRHNGQNSDEDVDGVHVYSNRPAEEHNVFHLSFGLDFCFQYQPFLMPTRVVLRPYSPKRELLLDWWWWGGWWERFSTECFKAESNHFKQSKLHWQSSESIKITQAIQCVNRNAKKKTTRHEARDEIVTIGFNIIPDSMKLVQISI